jgi:hypothetical protein
MCGCSCLLKTRPGSPDEKFEIDSMRNRKVAVTVNDLMQTGYVYYLTESPGKNFHSNFKPELTPKEMLELGVFGGRYLTDCRKEFPASWFKHAKLCHARHDPKLNLFGVNASQPLAVWRRKGWIYHEDPRGWFQWYCRYFMGRRCADDERQIKRWRAVQRHVAQLKQNCPRGALDCPAQTEAGAAALGLRFAQDLSREAAEGPQPTARAVETP